METIMVYLDDAPHALQQLAPMKAPRPEGQGPSTTHWVLVACAPRMTRRIGKWVSHSAREQWRAKWADKVFGQIVPALESQGDRVTPVLARGPLPELTRELMRTYGSCRVLDARRPKFGQDLPPVTETQPATTEGRWSVPGAVVGLGAALVLAAE